MKLNEIVKLMNMAQLDVAADGGSDLPLYGLNKIDMFHQDDDKILKTYGDREVTHITNIAFKGVTIWIK